MIEYETFKVALQQTILKISIFWPHLLHWTKTNLFLLLQNLTLNGPNLFFFYAKKMPPPPKQKKMPAFRVQSNILPNLWKLHKILISDIGDIFNVWQPSPLSLSPKKLGLPNDDITDKGGVGVYHMLIFTERAESVNWLTLTINAFQTFNIGTTPPP